MTEPDEVKEMLARFEKEMDVTEGSKNSDDVINKFEH